MADETLGETEEPARRRRDEDFAGAVGRWARGDLNPHILSDTGT
jgi:hypothetical protein